MPRAALRIVGHRTSRFDPYLPYWWARVERLVLRLFGHLTSGSPSYSEARAGCGLCGRLFRFHMKQDGTFASISSKAFYLPLK